MRLEYEGNIQIILLLSIKYTMEPSMHYLKISLIIPKDHIFSKTDSRFIIIYEFYN